MGSIRAHPLGSDTKYSHLPQSEEFRLSISLTPLKIKLEANKKLEEITFSK